MKNLILFGSLLLSASSVFGAGIGPLLFNDAGTPSDSTVYYNPGSPNRLGIGTAYPSAGLHIKDGGGVVISQSGGNWRFTGSDYGFSIAPYGFDLTPEQVKAATFIIKRDTGRVGIGTYNLTEALNVAGGIRATSVKVDTGWADYVFNDDYKLMNLDELSQYIEKENKLPGVPSAEEIAKEGLDLAEGQRILLEKVEELTLYVIQLKKENELIKAKYMQN